MDNMKMNDLNDLGNDVKSCVRVRYAPSPTGSGQHIGGVRTALYNYLLAKKHGGQFILRIEDTDQSRFVEGAEKHIEDVFNWLGLSFDESPSIGGSYGPYRQSERKDIYLPYAEQLVKDGFAYYAFDSSDELTDMRTKVDNFCYNFETRNTLKNSLNMSYPEVTELLKTSDDYVIRIKYPDTPIDIKFVDDIRGEIVINSSTLDDKVIWKKKDELPTYHLANVVDDHLMLITNVIRGEEWIPSAPLHIFLYDCFNWSKPSFAHLPLILGPNGGKLSKRDGDKYGFSVYPIGYDNLTTGTYVRGYKDNGFLPESVINFLAFIGWNPGTEKEVYTLDELIQDFDLSKVNKAGGKFNIEKANWFNGQHIKLKSSVDLLSDFKTILDEKGIELSNIATFKILESYKNKVNFLTDIITETSYLFNKPTDFDQKVLKKWKDNTNSLLGQLGVELGDVSDTYWNEVHLQKVFEDFVNSNEIKFGDIAPHLRLVLTGKGNGGSIFFIMELLGRTETMGRIFEYISK